jgi:hypothetical protein
MNPQWLAKYKPISDAFMAYGWFVAPFLIGAEFSVVEQTADYVAKNPPQNEQDRKNIEERIYRSLVEPAFAPTYRARATWYGNQLKHMRDFNHLYEGAMFSYYKREYAQTVLSLLTALEGVMLSFYGYNIGSNAQKPNIPDLISRIKNTAAPFPAGSPLATGHDMYRDTLVRFLEEWIYKKTSQSDFSLSVLNRHYVLHGMDAGNFYRPQDVHRLILAFDLMIEFLSFQQGVFHTFLPDVGKDAFIDARRNYYGALSFGMTTAAQSWAIERTLLKQHARYVAPPHDPNIQESLAAHAALMAEIAELGKRARAKGIAPRPPPSAAT